MSHTLPPKQCPSNVPTWTQDSGGISANTTPIRASHINDLRTRAIAEAGASRRNITAPTWSSDSPTVTAGSTKIKASHINDLRTALDNLRTGGGAGWPCQTDSFGATGNWTDTVTNTTKIRAAHTSELRSKMQYLMTACVCEAEQCAFCSDCGYAFTIGCTCECQNHQGCGCNNHPYSYNACASINIPTNGNGGHPYKAASGSHNASCSDYGCSFSTTAWDGTVPWAWNTYTPSNPLPWSNWPASPSHGYPHNTDWGCQCSPYTW